MNNELIAAERKGRIQEAIISGQKQMISNNESAISILHEGIDAIEAEHNAEVLSLNNVIDAQAAFIELLQEQLIKSGNNIVAEAQASIEATVIH